MPILLTRDCLQHLLPHQAPQPDSDTMGGHFNRLFRHAQPGGNLLVAGGSVFCEQPRLQLGIKRGMSLAGALGLQAAIAPVSISDLAQARSYSRSGAASPGGS